MDPKWFPGNDRPSYNANVIALIAFITQITTVLLPSKSICFSLGLPSFLYCAYQIHTHSAGATSDDYLASINLLWIFLRWVDLALLNNPEISFWQTDYPTEKRKDENPSPRSFLQKLRWIWSLCTTYRGIGWNWRVKNVDYIPSDVSKSKFVLIQSLKFIRSYIVSDFLSYYERTVVFPDPTLANLTALPPHMKVIVSWGCAIRMACDLSSTWYLVSVLAVSTQLSAPQDWPPVFGSWRKMYTMRKLWGYCWHQWLRRIFEVYTNTGARLLGLKPGTLAARYFKLYGSFLISAGIHHTGVLNIPWTPWAHYHSLYFVTQPFVITFEDLMVYIGKRLGIRESTYTHLLGFIWVGIAVSLTLPLIATSFYAWIFMDGLSSSKHPIIIWSFADHLLG